VVERGGNREQDEMVRRDDELRCVEFLLFLVLVLVDRSNDWNGVCNEFRAKIVLLLNEFSDIELET